MKAGLVALAMAAAAPPALVAPKEAEVPAEFSRCATCHATTKDMPHGLGNNLFGIYGKRAGVMPDYAYSDAMSSSRIVWNTATLDAFIADPRAVIPGTRMSSAKLADPEKRAAIIAYLKRLR